MNLTDKKHVARPFIKLFSSSAVFTLLLLPAGTGFAAQEAGDQIAVPLQQKKSNLLDGVQRGICYSGFRRGEHPDCGAGAANPTSREILEDLQLLARNNNFGLIRLYDSGENSADVLRLIQEHQIHLKALLGGWLDTEVSNPDCPWHKEAYPQQTLHDNKIKNQKQIERAIRLANEYQKIVVAVAVGNEAMVSWTDHKVPVQSVVAYVHQVKAAVKQPVTVCDSFAAWLSSGSVLAGELDFISIHSYPAWEGKAIEDAPHNHCGTPVRPERPAAQPHCDNGSRLGDRGE